MTQVLNKRSATAEQLANAVYIGRPSKWGNPFVIGKDGDRAEVIRRYELWLGTQPKLDPRELAGKNLVCWCSPQPCHGDVLVRLANGG